MASVKSTALEEFQGGRQPQQMRTPRSIEFYTGGEGKCGALEATCNESTFSLKTVKNPREHLLECRGKRQDIPWFFVSSSTGPLAQKSSVRQVGGKGMDPI